MGCMEASRLVQDFVDGALNAEQARRLAAHLEDCRRCGLEIDIYERIKASLAAGSTAPLPQDALDRLTAFGHRLTLE